MRWCHLHTDMYTGGPQLDVLDIHLHTSSLHVPGEQPLYLMIPERQQSTDSDSSTVFQEHTGAGPIVT